MHICRLFLSDSIPVALSKPLVCNQGKRSPGTLPSLKVVLGKVGHSSDTLSVGRVSPILLQNSAFFIYEICN